VRFTLFLSLAMFSSVAHADQWMPPVKQVLESADHSVRLTVLPRDITSPLAYFQDKVTGHEPAGAPTGSKATSATAILENRDSSGRWVASWTQPLVNEVAPVDVVVANDGRGFVTFDNWHSMGYGPHAIVAYDGQGNLIRALALEDVFPKWFVAAQLHSVSSIWWRGQPRVSDDGTAVVVPIKLPSHEQSMVEADGHTLDLFVRLSDGEPVGLTGQAWKAAFVAAAATAREMCRAGRDSVTQWNAPIAAPTEWAEPEWHNYLREIVYRSAPSLNEDSAPVLGTTVLRPPTALDFRRSIDWLKDALTEKTAIPDYDVRAIGSPDYERLTKEIEGVASKINAGRLKGVQLVVVVDEPHSTRVRAALSRSGAQLRIVDPLAKFPQRPERVQNADATELSVCQAPPL
jgi:hypothetical protein